MRSKCAQLYAGIWNVKTENLCSDIVPLERDNNA